MRAPQLAVKEAQPNKHTKGVQLNSRANGAHIKQSRERGGCRRGHPALIENQ